MVYNALNAREFRERKGTPAEKITTELANIDAEFDIIQALASGYIIVGNGGGMAADVAMSGDTTITNTGVVTIGAGKVTLANHVIASEDGTVAKEVAEANVIGGLLVVFMIPIAAGALGDTNVVMTHKVRVLEAHLILRGAGVATTTLQVKNGANAITDAMAASGADQAIVRAASIDDANYEIAAGGTLRVTSATGASQPAALVVMTAIRVT